MARSLKHIDAKTAAKLRDKGALMADVREVGEFARARIPGSHNLALSRLDEGELPLAPKQAVVFLCASGGRTGMHAPRLAEKAGAAEAYVLQGGLSAWSREGLPVESGQAHKSHESAGGGFFARLFSR